MWRVSPLDDKFNSSVLIYKIRVLEFLSKFDFQARMKNIVAAPAHKEKTLSGRQTACGPAGF